MNILNIIINILSELYISKTNFYARIIKSLIDGITFISNMENVLMGNALMEELNEESRKEIFKKVIKLLKEKFNEEFEEESDSEKNKEVLSLDHSGKIPQEIIDTFDKILAGPERDIANEVINLYPKVLENCKAYIQIYYYNNNNQKIVLYRYPIELYVWYDIKYYRPWESFIIKLERDSIYYAFRHTNVRIWPDVFSVWTPSYLGKKGDFIMGEWFKGKFIYNEEWNEWREHPVLEYKLMYVIKDKYGIQLGQNWPIWEKIILKQNITVNLPNSRRSVEAFVEFQVDKKTLQIRDISITQRLYNLERAIDFYNKNYKNKPTIFMMFENKTQFQLILVEWKKNSYYTDFFTGTNHNLKKLFFENYNGKGYGEGRNRYILYKMEWWAFEHEWWSSMEKLRYLIMKMKIHKLK